MRAYIQVNQDGMFYNLNAFLGSMVRADMHDRRIETYVEWWVKWS